MKPLEKLFSLFRRRRAPEPETPVEEPPPAIDTRQDWQKKIDRINELCNERKRLDLMTQGGRVITEAPPPYRKGDPNNGHRSN